MKTIIISVKLLLFMTLITGIIYPLFIFGIARIISPNKSTGMLMSLNNVIIGSELIGQKFTSNKYFHPRPSAIDYSALPSGGSNLGPTSQNLKTKVDSLRQAYITLNGLPENTEVPYDAVFSSASGIDPHISTQNAMLQVDRISKERGFDANKHENLIELIRKQTEEPQFGIFGEERINVLILNVELDKL